jgi:uncharacterized NAD-dependent epimerase/dehydratase family protein
MSGENSRDVWQSQMQAKIRRIVQAPGRASLIDAVVSDFAAGAAEALSPSNQPDHWDIIEGQGSLHHPAYAGVTLALIHGSQPDALVLCHAMLRERIDGYAEYRTPQLAEAIATNEMAARLTNPGARVIGISVNTKGTSEQRARDYLSHLEQTFSIPCCDPVRTGIGAIVDKCMRPLIRVFPVSA